MNDDRLTNIEIKLAHQEQLVDELNTVITDQQGQIDRLEIRCNSLLERLQSAGDGGAVAAADDERPPHY